MTSVDDARDALDVMRLHAAHFTKKVYRIDDGIHLAVGFAASNVAMIEAPEGLVIIDTTESTSAATRILKAFREISAAPVAAIIYTHSHRDHISGAKVFAGDDAPGIHASADLASDLVAEANAGTMPAKSLGARTRAQFGMGLEAEQRIHIGLGPGDRPVEGLGAGYLAPTHRFERYEQKIEIAGFEMTVFPAPGETHDHVNIWLEDRRILFCGDNFYHAFPNLYAIRGTPYRDFEAWATTLEGLASRGAEVLVPGHSQPVFGRDEVRERLETTADAIREVIRQAVDGMNAGLDFETIASRARLPDALADKPWLVEHYGSFAYAVRACCVGLMGWYSGNAEELVVRDPASRARDWLELAGGGAALVSRVDAALADGRHEFVIELCALGIRAGVDAPRLRRAMATSLAHFASTSINAPARHTLLDAAAGYGLGDGGSPAKGKGAG